MRTDLINCGTDYISEVLRVDIIEARQDLGLTQKELADNAGVPRSTLNKYEAKEAPSRWTPGLAKICDALGIDLAEYGYTPGQADDDYHKGPRRSKRVNKPTYSYHDFGRRMQAVRLNHRLTQEDLGRLIWVASETICVWEIGLRLPSARHLAHWCQVMGEPTEEWALLRLGAKDRR